MKACSCSVDVNTGTSRQRGSTAEQLCWCSDLHHVLTTLHAEPLNDCFKADGLWDLHLAGNPSTGFWKRPVCGERSLLLAGACAAAAGWSAAAGEYTVAGKVALSASTAGCLGLSRLPFKAMPLCLAHFCTEGGSFSAAQVINAPQKKKQQAASTGSVNWTQVSGTVSCLFQTCMPSHQTPSQMLPGLAKHR